VLSALQEQIAQVVAALPEADGFALAGGAALVLRGEVDRDTRDLDFFATEATAVSRLLPAAEAALTAAGLTVERDRVSEGFARIVVHGEAEATIVDLGYDFRAHPPEMSRLGPILGTEDLAASKLLALFGRAEARDFIDVAALGARYGFEWLCSLATEHDPGFNLEALADALGSFGWLPRLDFDVDDAGYARLREVVSEWQEWISRQTST
jgi:hypothetical protein